MAASADRHFGNITENGFWTLNASRRMYCHILRTPLSHLTCNSSNSIYRLTNKSSSSFQLVFIVLLMGCYFRVVCMVTFTSIKNICCLMLMMLTFYSLVSLLLCLVVFCCSFTQMVKPGSYMNADHPGHRRASGGKRLNRLIFGCFYCS